MLIKLIKLIRLIRLRKKESGLLNLFLCCLLEFVSKIANHENSIEIIINFEEL